MRLERVGVEILADVPHAYPEQIDTTLTSAVAKALEASGLRLPRRDPGDLDPGGVGERQPGLVAARMATPPRLTPPHHSSAVDVPPVTFGRLMLSVPGGIGQRVTASAVGRAALP